MNKLYIYGGVENDVSEAQRDCSNTVYYINAGRLHFREGIAQCINNTKRVHKIALEQRSKYSDYIYDLNEEFVSRRLIFRNQLSCYFITDFSNKRSEIYATYSHLCHLLYLQQYLREKSVDEIECVSCPDEFIEGIKSIYAGRIKCDRGFALFKRNALPWLILKQGIYFCKVAVKRLIGSFIHCSTNVNGVINKLFMTFYPVHLTNEGKEIKYCEYVSKDDWFLVSVLADGCLCHPKLFAYISNLRRLTRLAKKQNIILLDELIFNRDIAAAFLHSISILMRGWIFTKKRFNYSGIDLSGYLRCEVERSLTRIPKIAIYDRAMYRLFSKTKIANFYYYLFEYSFGRFMTWASKTYSPDTVCVGYQHGPAAWRKCLYSISKREVDHESEDYTRYLPLPDKVLAEDELAKKILVDAGYLNVSVMSKIYRLHYLENINRGATEKNTVLVATGLHDSMNVVHYLEKICTEKPDTTFYLKIHPKVDSAPISDVLNRRNYPNVTLAKEPLEYYLNRVENVIVTYSSVGNEAYALNIPVTLLCTPSRINESTLMDISDTSILIRYFDE